jgi:hypothetical protein
VPVAGKGAERVGGGEGKEAAGGAPQEREREPLGGSRSFISRVGYAGYASNPRASSHKAAAARGARQPQLGEGRGAGGGGAGGHSGKEAGAEVALRPAMLGDAADTYAWEDGVEAEAGGGDVGRGVGRGDARAAAGRGGARGEGLGRDWKPVMSIGDAHAAARLAAPPDWLQVDNSYLNPALIP